MASFNKVMLMGNLTRDPELRQLPSGQAVTTLRLAVSRPYRTASGENREDTLFVDVIAWGRQAETCNTYLRKGSTVFVEGSLRLEQWQDKETGQNRQRHSVTAERVQFINTPRNDNGGGQYQQQAQQPMQNSTPQSAPIQSPPSFQEAPQAVQQQPAPAINAAPQSAPAFQQPAASKAPFNPVGQQQSTPQNSIPPAPVFDTDDLEDDIPF